MIEPSFVGLKWLVASISTGKKDYIPSLEVYGTRNEFPQLIVNSSFIILYSITICYTLH